MNSVDMLLIPWSKEGQNEYPYRYSSVVCVKYFILLLIYSTYIIITFIYDILYPKYISHQKVIDPLELKIFDMDTLAKNNTGSDSDGENNEDNSFLGGSNRGHNNILLSTDDDNVRIISSFKNGLTFIPNGFMILIMEICIFNILNHIPASTFAIIRNLVIPCTALIRGIFFSEKPSLLQWLALTGITAVASSFASQDIIIYDSINNDIPTSWFWLGTLLMISFIALESINIVYLERKFKSNIKITFSEKQFWVTFWCFCMTFLFWFYDNKKNNYHGKIFIGYTPKTVFLVIWRTFHGIIIFFMVKYLTSVVTVLVHTIGSLGTAVLEFIFMSTTLKSGQWFDALAVAALCLIYKIAPYDKQEHRRFEILHVDDDDDDSL